MRGVVNCFGRRGHAGYFCAEFLFLASVARTIRQRYLDLTTVFTTLLRDPRPTVAVALQDQLH
jgi:hypothetical protein